jgi:excisionase family DNA binding protein
MIMRVSYDPKVDAFYIQISSKSKDKHQEITDDVIDYTPDEAAEILKVNKETILCKIRGGKSRASGIGKYY